MACIAVTSIHDHTAARSADGTAQTGGTPTTVADAIAVVGRRTDVANQVGGQYAKVSAIMSNPDTDPGRPRISTRSRAPHRQFGQARVADHNGGYRAGGVSGAITESSSPPYPRRAPVADGSLIP